MGKVIIFVATWLLLSICAFAQDYTQPKVWSSSALTGSPVTVKGSQARLYGTYGSNRSQCPRYIKVFDKPASEVRLGVDRPILNLEVLPRSTQWFPELQERLMERGLTFACTRKSDDFDTRPARSGECYATALYQ
jgi:hypothetical protein